MKNTIERVEKCYADHLRDFHGYMDGVNVAEVDRRVLRGAIATVARSVETTAFHPSDDGW